jgi:CRP-like cAMP-binding protein
MLNALRQYVSKYTQLTDDEFALLGQMLEVRSFDKKQQLIQAGDVENYLNFIVKGLARKYFYRGKTEVITQLARENDMISSSVSFLSGAPSTYFIETLEPSTFLSISRQHVEKLYKENPRIERLGRLIITHFFLQKEEWEHECIRLDTRERFIRFIGSNPDFMQRVPQKYLASYLNMKPETFSRLKHLLKKRPVPRPNEAAERHGK